MFVFKTILTLFIFPFSLPVYADYETARAAYEAGNYEMAFKEVFYLAEKVSAKSQNRLGTMYHDVLGVPQDYAKAAKWYQKAAEQGVAEAQHNLGSMYKQLPFLHQSTLFLTHFKEL